jgi:hypothetical protein
VTDVTILQVVYDEGADSYTVVSRDERGNLSVDTDVKLCYHGSRFVVDGLVAYELRMEKLIE